MNRLPGRGGLTALFALLVVLVLYAPGCGDYLLFDSRVALSLNPALDSDGKQLEDWRLAALSSSSGPLGRPLTMLSFAANRFAAGSLVPWQLRFTNVLIHAATALMVYAFLRLALTGSTTARLSSRSAGQVAGLAALIWLLHPLHVSTVLYTVQRMAQLSTLFVLLGLWVYLRYRVRWVSTAPATGELAAAILWLGLILLAGVASKENALLLLWLLPVVELTLFRGECSGRRRPQLTVLAWLAALAPLVLLAGLWLLSPGTLTGGFAGRDFTLQERLLTEARVLWYYVGWLLVPDLTAMSLHHDDVVLSRSLLQPWTTLVAVCSWAVALCAAFALRRVSPLPLFGLLFFLVGHSMESTVFGLELVYEHRNYLPSVGLFTVLAWGLCSWLGDHPARVRVAGAGALLVVLALLTGWRASVWSNEADLAAFQLRHHPDSARANYHVANMALRRAQRASDPTEVREQVLLARHYYKKQQQLAPDSLAALASLYYVDSVYFPGLQDQVDWFAKLHEAARSTVIDAEDRNALVLLADCLLSRQCRRPAADIDGLFTDLLAASPRGTQVSYQYARLQSELLDRPEAARRSYEGLIQRRPDYAPAYYALMQWHAGRGDTAAAIELSRQLLMHDGDRREQRRLAEIFAAGSSVPND